MTETKTGFWKSLFRFLFRKKDVSRVDLADVDYGYEEAIDFHDSTINKLKS